jgi:hypothetical protein
MNTPTPTETLMGGRKFPALKRDNTTEDIFIRQIGIEDCQSYLELQDNELAMIEFVCSKPDGWAKSLAPQCQAELIAEIDRINADFFSRWVERQKSRQERLMPGITEKRLAALLASQTSQPKPPSNAASV